MCIQPVSLSDYVVAFFFHISVCGNVSPLLLRESKREQFNREIMVCMSTVVAEY